MICFLKDIASIKYGKDYKGIDSPNGEYPIIGTGGVIGWTNEYIYDGESVLIGRIGTINKPQYINGKFWTVNTLFYTEIDKTKCLPRWLFYYLSLINLENFNKGTSTPCLRISTLESIEIQLHPMQKQHHIVNTIGSVDDLIENYQERIEKICNILDFSLKKFVHKIPISYYKPEIIKSGILSFTKTKDYIETSKIENLSIKYCNQKITYTHRPSRANMQPVENSVWFSKMKNSNKKLIIHDDFNLINNYILSTGFLGVKSSNNLPLSFLSAIVISKDFNVQRDLNSTGTLMEGINNETFLKILVPKLSDYEIIEYNQKFFPFIKELCILRRKIYKLENIKVDLLLKYF